MAEELGKIEKPPADEFKEGRKLYFVPLVYISEELPDGYLEKFNKYWEQVKKQIAELELKLGKVNRIYHELIPAGGEDGIQAIKELSDKSHEIIKACMDGGAQLETVEEPELLNEFMDWNRCLFIGLQSQKAVSIVYESYLEVSKQRNGFISRKIDETLKADETGILLMRENHQVQFPSDIHIFYVAPPALDDIKRWLRDSQAKPEDKS